MCNNILRAAKWHSLAMVHSFEGPGPGNRRPLCVCECGSVEGGEGGLACNSGLNKFTFQ